MEWGEWYKFFFDNHGKCPECGGHLVVSVGCVNLECRICQNRLWIPVPGRAMAERTLMRFVKKLYRVKIADRKFNERRNLDNRGKKQYFEVDD